MFREVSSYAKEICEINKHDRRECISAVIHGMADYPQAPKEFWIDVIMTIHIECDNIGA